MTQKMTVRETQIARDVPEASVKREGQFYLIWRQLRKKKSAIISGIILLVLTFVAIFAPHIAPYDPLAISPVDTLDPPGKKHLLGTDHLGRDILSRLIFGARVSLRLGVMSVGIAGIVGVILGLFAGYYGGWLDSIIMRFMDILLAFPGILLALGVVAVLGPGITNVMIAVGVSSIPTFTRLVRGSVLVIKEMEHIQAARIVGCGHTRIIFLHILPNVIAPSIVVATLGIAGAILAGAGLSFLGVGAQPPTPEWGLMVNEGRRYLRIAWWVTTIPGIVIMVTVLAANILGDGLRDAIDPRLRM
ncbi:MAG: ABC transporter permease [Candidatus Tectomicrobia bacterium]|nr:ABC transporter permease [Candidatus Tectomicrobia bacterium]